MGTRYRDALGRTWVASQETLVGVLRALGEPLDGPGDAPASLAARRAELASRWLEPVAVAWSGRPAQLRLRVPARVTRVDVEIDPEPSTPGPPRGYRASVRRDGSVDLPADLGVGYHRLRVRAGRREGDALLIAAPGRCAPVTRPTWGPFLPLHALRGPGDWGTGDVRHLRQLLDWTAGLGGGLVATLPLFATFVGEGEPFDPSPYAPVSRLHWSELYVDLTALPELHGSEEARAVLGSPAFRAELRRLRSTRLVDHAGVAAVKGRVLGLLAASLRAEPSGRRDAFERFVRGRPDVADYARFRAATSASGTRWRAWPARMRDGRVRPADVPPEAVDLHLYAQWVAEQQLAAVVDAGAERDAALLLDLPLGVHPDGFDTWRHRSVFVEGATAGAPPDTLFTKGQQWGFPPLHPQRVREQGYRYPIACLRTLMARAGIVRIDHVMSLHRLFWIPDGMPATAGAYVANRADEWYAIVAVESNRSRCAVVGEDLGTVPAAVRPRMRRHGLLRTAVVQYEVRPDPRDPLPPAPGAMAAVNTHDMPPFAAYWRELDIDDRLRRGLLDAGRAVAARRERSAVRRALLAHLGVDDEDAALRALLACLAAGQSDVVVANLEDLWAETLPQNVPGTGAEEPNWRRKARRSFGTFGRDPSVVGTLEGLTRLRRRR